MSNLKVRKHMDTQNSFLFVWRFDGSLVINLITKKIQLLWTILRIAVKYVVKYPQIMFLWKANAFYFIWHLYRSRVMNFITKKCLQFYSIFSMAVKYEYVVNFLQIRFIWKILFCLMCLLAKKFYYCALFCECSKLSANNLYFLFKLYFTERHIR